MRVQCRVFADDRRKPNNLRKRLVILIQRLNTHLKIMQLDNVYYKAVRSWLEAHGQIAAAGSLSGELVRECQVEGMSVADAAAEVLRLTSVLAIAAK
jgi:hypothetical protein